MKIVLRLAVSVFAALGCLVLMAASAQAHPMPHSVVELDVDENSVTATLQLPLDDLGLAVGQQDLNGLPDGTLAEPAGTLRDYLAAHFRVTTETGKAWAVVIGDIGISAAEQTSTGPYRELTATARLSPPNGVTTRSFVLHDDAIMHQVVTHTIFISVTSDWASGNIDAGTEVGVIRINTGTGQIAPLTVNLGYGTYWTGFKAMISLGADHILGGTDHLLFLLTLLLPAPLLVAGRRWGPPCRPRRAVKRIAGITLAFTIGHSVTLALSALGRIEIPPQPVEALIAFSVLVSAAHALRPIFPGREVLVAGFFGLVHGMAFSLVLAELGLSTPQLVLSLLGFNLGIELMQITVVALVLPALVLLAQTTWYSPVRIVGATVAGVAAIAWLLARLGVPNAVAGDVDGVVPYQLWIVTR